MSHQLIKLNKDNCAQAFLLQQHCHPVPWSRALFESCFEDMYFAYQLVEQSKCVGYYVGLVVGPEATLMDIGIDQEHRGKRFAHVLMNHFELQCKSRNAEECWLEVRESNQAALALYRKWQFAEIEVRANYYENADGGREDAVIMKKELG